MSEELIERLRANPLWPTGAHKSLTAEAADRIAELEADVELVVITNEALNSVIDRCRADASTSQARLSEAVKVLEEAIPLLDDAADKLEAEGMWGTSERDMAIRARQFLANLGEENVR